MVYTASPSRRLGIPASTGGTKAARRRPRRHGHDKPQAIAMAAMFDADMVEHIGSIIAEEGRAKIQRIFPPERPRHL